MQGINERKGVDGSLCVELLVRGCKHRVRKGPEGSPRSQGVKRGRDESEAFGCLAADLRLRLQDSVAVTLATGGVSRLSTPHPGAYPNSASSPPTTLPANQYSYRPPPHFQLLAQWDTHTLSHSRMPIPILVPRSYPPSLSVVRIISNPPATNSFSLVSPISFPLLPDTSLFLLFYGTLACPVFPSFFILFFSV